MITSQLRKLISKDILDFLERERITSAEEMKKKEGETWMLKKGVYALDFERRIEIAARPSDFGVASALSYIIYGLGIPLEIRINQTIGSTSFIIKDSQQLPTYQLFARDPSGNYILLKDLSGNEFAQMNYPTAAELRGIRRTSRV
ncbi:MAG: hypothetical protein AABX86_00880 [Nanoarchaeota archaeon]